ncbi:MAG: hypothetical protein ACI8Y7_000092 [Candidatus Woesearchaeota archaeon]|jgi:hypothetical protein
MNLQTPFTIESLLTSKHEETDFVQQQERVRVRVDYRVILQSNYISKRISDLAGKSYEVAFLYGANVKTKQVVQELPYQETEITLDDLVLPIEQRITGSSFHVDEGAFHRAQQYLQDKGKRVHAMGHSHAAFDVFHSNTDYQNLERQVFFMGVPIKPMRKFRRALQQKHTRIKPVSKRSEKIHVLPSLVFNEKGSVLHSVLAIRYGSNKDTFHLKRHPIELYNKKCVLTDIDRKALDKKVYQILRYNNIKIKKEYLCKSAQV